MLIRTVSTDCFFSLHGFQQILYFLPIQQRNQKGAVASLALDRTIRLLSVYLQNAFPLD